MTSLADRRIRDRIVPQGQNFFLLGVLLMD